MTSNTGTAPGDDDTGHDEPMLEIANEFALVHVRRVHTHNGIRLEITSPRLGHRIQLDPLQLESLTWQSPDIFTEFLRTPMGPEDESR